MSKIHKNRIYATRAECFEFEVSAANLGDLTSATIAAFGGGVALGDLVIEELKRMADAASGTVLEPLLGSVEYLPRRSTVIERLKSGLPPDAKRRTQLECRALVLQWMRETAEVNNAQH